MKKLMFLTVAIAILAFIAPEAMADAKTAGEGLAKGLIDTISGNLGLFIGIALALFGLWTWLVGQNSWGIIMIIGGVVITAFPGIFAGVSNGVEGILATMGSNYDGRANTTNKQGEIGVVAN